MVDLLGCDVWTLMGIFNLSRFCFSCTCFNNCRVLHLSLILCWVFFQNQKPTINITYVGHLILKNAWNIITFTTWFRLGAVKKKLQSICTVTFTQNTIDHYLLFHMCSLSRDMLIHRKTKPNGELQIKYWYMNENLSSTALSSNRIC